MSLLAAVCLFHSTLFAPQNQVSEVVASEDVWAINPASKDWPLEARGLSAVFDEKKFVFENAAKISPTESLYGTGVVTEGEIDKEARIIKINLLDKKSKFSEDVKAYLGNSKPMCLALTSKYDVAEMGMKGIYKVFSKDNKDSVVRPRLILEFK
ncbi:MAG: hypothetical protein LW628_07630 [Fimbriimonadaceae bacterium]|nr:hypothetical protein [Fimbriimonadaceae bacterium]